MIWSKEANIKKKLNTKAFYQIFGGRAFVYFIECCNLSLKYSLWGVILRILIIFVCNQYQSEF